jgi:plasmid stabilization system protein ParE
MRVIIPDAVQDQITAQVMHIAADSIDNALAWEHRVDPAILGLAEFAGYAVDADASERLGQPLRRLVFEGTYLIHFRVDTKERIVEIVNFRHGARLPSPDEP